MAESVTVGVRIRPLNSRELASKNASVAWRGDNEHNTVFRTDGVGGASASASTGTGHTFRFDNVFTAQTTNEAVYTDLASPVVEAALGGFNATMFAYGQTSSGKTHSMLGDEKDPGITPRAIRHVLQTASTSRTREFLIRAVYVEIYNDRIRDLLNPGASDLAVREDAAGRTFVDACETVVHTFDDAIQVLEKGQAARHIGETKMNARSSRSHTVFTLHIESKPKLIPDDDDDLGNNEENGTNDENKRANGDNTKLKKKGNGGGEQKSFRASSLNLVDLAGSERVKSTGATGKRQKEGAHINQSLLVLGTIINRLSAAAAGTKVGHLPYRDSKLTRLLRPALGGNARTAILCAITPAAAHAEETLSTLKFAERAKKVTNHARRNEVVDYRAKYKQASTEVTVLRERLAAMEMELAAMKTAQAVLPASAADPTESATCAKCQQSEADEIKNSDAERTPVEPLSPAATSISKPVDTSVVTSASSSPLSTPSIPVESPVHVQAHAHPALESQGSAESSSSATSTASTYTTNSTASSMSTVSSAMTSSSDASSSALSTLGSGTSTGSSLPITLTTPVPSDHLPRGGGAPLVSTTVSSADPRARKLHSDTDAAVKREVELRAMREEARYLKAHADEAELENEALRERLRGKAKEFSSLRSRAVELRSLAREARTHERSLLRLVRSSFEQLEEARGQLDASRKKGSHVLLAEDKLTLLSQSLTRYARLGEEALRQDARAKHERAVVVRPKGTVATTGSSSSSRDTGNPNVSVDNLAGRVNVGGQQQNADDVEKAAALALRLGGIDEDLAAAFSLRPPPGANDKKRAQQSTSSTSRPPMMSSSSKSSSTSASNGRQPQSMDMKSRAGSASSASASASATPRARGAHARNRSRSSLSGNGGVNLTKSSSNSTGSDLGHSSSWDEEDVSGRGRGRRKDRDDIRRRPRPLPEDMVADIDDDDVDDGDDGKDDEKAAAALGQRTADWAEIDADIDRAAQLDGQANVGDSEGGDEDRSSSEGASGKAKKSRWQAMRSFYGYGQTGVYDVMVVGHKVDGKSATGLAR